MTTGKYPHVVNVFFVLAQVRVEVESGRVCHVATGFIGDNGDVVADLALVRIAFERVERIAHRNVSRPGNAGIGAKGIKQLRIRVISSVARVIPDRVKSSIGRYRECAEPMPLAGINWIVIDLLRSAEGEPVVGATHEHYVGRASP